MDRHTGDASCRPLVLAIAQSEETLPRSRPPVRTRLPAPIIRGLQSLQGEARDHNVTRKGGVMTQVKIGNWLHGKRRKKFVYHDGELPPDVEDRFYSGTVTGTLVRSHPEKQQKQQQRSQEELPRPEEPSSDDQSNQDPQR